MSTATERFAALLRAPEEAIPLDAACLLIAAAVRPDTRAGAAGDTDAVVADGLEELDRLAARCPPDLDVLRRRLFEEEGFAGNRLSYDDPRNSYLDEVLHRRTGIPITLAVVVIEVARRVGLQLAAVGMPGHFLVGAGGGRYLDAFDGGRLLDVEACRRRFAELAGPDARWAPDLLSPVGARAVLARVLANLRSVFAAADDLVSLASVLELRSAIPGVPAAERAERSAVLAALGRFDEAAAELDRLAATQPADATRLRSSAAALRARLN
jgi:regulator of sirC expression with transglutaminase-like and TPR domain